ncbi:MAG TPA: hypothetical protein VKT28_20415 [Puia sp.]|nr:hypothetical protein [Puia sp.]
MEVHHHPNVEKKNFKEYFLEFLMIFLAVTMGFIAENIREHFVDKWKEKHYIESLYEDLKNDTARLSVLIDYDDKKIAALSNMSNCYDTVMKNVKASYCMADMVDQSRTNRNFDISDRTLRQLANAGGFHVLEQSDADSIIAYETLFRNYHNYESTAFQEAQDNVRNTLNLLADFRANKELQSSPSITGDTAKGKLDMPLLFSDDKVLLNKYFNESLIYLRVHKGQRGFLIRLKARAEGLIKYYKDKHQLD